jgi:large subunit ribosomal protein L27
LSHATDQYVIPGNIIYKQFGTLWWPGENCNMGRDFTIHATASGYVKYYRDPARHPDRKYIGVTFEKDDTLPYPQHAERHRRLGKTAVPIPKPEPIPDMSPSGIPTRVVRVDPTKPGPPQVLGLRPNYSYRESNWAIGRLVENLKPRVKKYSSRKAYLRHRRYAREKSLEGLRKRDERLKASQDGKGEKKKEKKKAKKAA